MHYQNNQQQLGFLGKSSNITASSQEHPRVLSEVVPVEGVAELDAWPWAYHMARMKRGERQQQPRLEAHFVLDSVWRLLSRDPVEGPRPVLLIIARPGSLASVKVTACLLSYGTADREASLATTVHKAIRS